MSELELPFENQDIWQYLALNSYLSERYKLLYVATPKVACTTLKWWFASLVGCTQALIDSKCSNETHPDLVIHDVFCKVAPDVTGLPPTKLAEPLTSDDFFRFAVVRNPYKRLFSAWQSKLLLREPLQVKPYQNCDFLSMPIESVNDIAIAFESFVEHLASKEAPNFWDLHWTPQVTLLRPDLIPYNKLMQIENVQELDLALINHLGSGIASPFGMGQTNESLISYLPEFFTERAISLIKVLYEADFKAFGYDYNLPDAKGEFTKGQLDIAINAIKLIRGRHKRFDEVRNLTSNCISNLEEELARRDVQIADINKQYLSYKEDADRQTEQLFERQSKLERHGKQVIEQKFELERQHEQVVEQKVELERQNEQLIEQKHGQMVELERQHEQLVVQNVALERQNEQLIEQKHGQMVELEWQNEQLIEQKHGQMVELERQNEQLIEEKHGQMVELKRQNEQLIEEKHGQMVELERQHEQLVKQKVELERQHEQLVKHKVELEWQHEQMIEQKHGQMVELERQNKQLVEQKVELERQNEQLIEQKHGQMVELERQHEQLVKQMVELERQNEQLVEQKVELERQNEQLVEQKVELERQNEQLVEQKHGQLVELERQNEQLSVFNRDFNTLNGTLNVVLSSRSWRLTKPLRGMNGFFRKSSSKRVRVESYRQKKVSEVEQESLMDSTSRLINEEFVPEKASTSLLIKEEFSPKLYLALYPDVAAACIDPLDHYLNNGKNEGRIGCFPKSVNFECLEGVDSSKETVLVVSHEGSRTGAPILSYNIIIELLRKYNVIAFFLGPGPIIDACKKEGAIIIAAEEERWPVKLSEIIVEDIANRVNLKYGVVNSIESRCVLSVLAKKFVPTVSLIHEFAAYTRPHGAFREAVRWSDHTVFSANITRDNAIEEYPEFSGLQFAVIPQGRCLVSNEGKNKVPEASELNRIRLCMRPSTFPANGLVVLGAGSVQIRKGVDLFIDCAARILRLKPEFPIRFVWVGKGYDPKIDSGYSVYLADQIKRSGLEQHLVFLDEVTDLSEVYANADLMLLTSRLDPLPNVAIDSLDQGLPVLCFDKTTGIADVLKNNALGDTCVAHYLDTKELAEKTTSLLLDSDLRESVSGLSAALSAKTFNMRNYVNEIDRLASLDERIKQQQLDLDIIQNSGVLDLDYFNVPGHCYGSDEEAIICYLRSWSIGLNPRKLFPGFEPGVYAEVHGCESPFSDPLADYIRSGQPEGPWNIELITDSNEQIKASVIGDRRVCLHIHAFYPDLVPPIIERLTSNSVRPDLLVSVTDEKAKNFILDMLSDYPEDIVDVRVVPNRGRDIGPFLTEFGAKIKNNYDFVGHIHTKKTVDLEDSSVGENWFYFILENLLGGHANMADTILTRMATDSKVGMVFPDDPNVICWGENKEYAEQMLKHLDLIELPEQIVCPIGTMFWASVNAIKPFLDLGLTWDDYPEEPLPYDGSVLHAIERLLPLPLTKNGYQVLTTNVSKVTR